MKKLMLAAALLAGLFVSAPSAHAHGHNGVHVGGAVHVGVGGVHVGVGGGGVRVDVGGYRGYHGGYHGGYNGHYGYPRPYPQPYPRPYPLPYPAPVGSITVLVTDFCSPYPHYVRAYWDNIRGGYWYYDCNGFYRRAR